MSIRLSFQRSLLEGALYERAVFFVSCLLLLVIPVMGLFAHRGFAPSLLILSIVCGANILVWQQFAERSIGMVHKTDRFMQCVAAYTGLCLWILLAALWSPLNDRGTLFLNVLLPAVSAGGVFWAWHRLPKASIHTLGILYCVFVYVTVALLAFETISGALLRDIVPPKDLSWNRHSDFISLGRGASALVLMVFPAVALLYFYTRKMWPALLLLGLTAISAIGLGIFSNALALGSGIFAGLVTLRFPKAGTRILIAVFILALFLMPIFASMISAETLQEHLTGILPVSWLQRFYIWETIGDAIPSGLPFGHGVDYARWLSIDSPTVDIPGAFGPLPLVPIHPHNVFLQIWLELGIPGAALFSLVIFSGARALSVVKLEPSLQAIVVALLACVFISFCLEASLWQVWRLCCIGIAGLGVLLACKVRNQEATNI